MKQLHEWLIPVLLVLSQALILSAQEVWRETTHADFVDGTFDDAGANMYVSHNGRIQTVNRWDVNNDGHIDIFCVNSHPLVEMLDMSIYWGNGADFSIRDHSYVPVDGPMWVAADDLDNDGEMDLVVANYSNGTWTEMESFVYYGGLKDRNAQKAPAEWAFYPFNKRVKLPGANAQKPAVADLNGDGYKDIVFAFSGGFWEYRDKSKKDLSPSRIYWGSKDGFDAKHYENIWTKGATDVAMADLNADKRLDLIFSNGEGDSSFIYYGGGKGFSEKNLKKLPTKKPHAIEVGDVNNDGAIDIVFANEAGTTSVAYLNENGAFDAGRRVEFQTHTAKDIVIEDFNKDGYADVFFTNHQHSLTGDPKLANRLIDSYLYFGSKTGFSENNRQSIQTIGAWGANAADLNEDGWVDLLICNFQEHYSYEVPSFIYWNGPDGFQLTRRTCLYEHGAQGNAIADFNGDGRLDILITSMMGNSRGDYDPCYLYFGNEKGQYSITDRIELPGREGYEQAFADLDDDGQVDILLVNRGEVTRKANELWIYWNEKNTFNPWNMTGLPNYGGIGVEVADLDRDGHLDIIISNSESGQKTADGKPEPGSFIYWGETKGWPVAGRSELPIVETRAVAVCDINADGHLDLVCGQQRNWGDASIFLGDGSRHYSDARRIRIEGSNGTSTPGVADLNKDGRLDVAFAHDKNVLVYYQQKDGSFTKAHSQSIPVQAKTMCVADVNSDGWLDLICPLYKGRSNRSGYSTVLLGSENGYALDRAIKLYTDGGTGSIVSDFNRDGYPDIFFFCHRTDGSFDEIGRFGDHHTNSLLYWGGAQGFKESDRLEIPSVGVHYDVGVDLGHIRDRSFVFEYFSSAYQCKGKKPVQLSWRGQTPHRSSIKFQLRVADTRRALAQAAWLGEEGIGSYFEEPEQAIKDIPAGHWIQYKAVFDTDNGAYSPILDEVEILFE
ncbi:VCBS repeat-containing protein [candidate division KSB1 bacterium]|nr:VCBS repeat-containing protein [candidate division KSB1 bacterium]